MEVYTSILEVETVRQPSNMVIFEAMLKEAMLRNHYLLRMYSQTFKNTSRKILPFKIRRYIINNREQINFPYQKQIVRRKSAPTFPTVRFTIKKTKEIFPKKMKMLEDKPTNESEVLVQNCAESELKNVKSQQLEEVQRTSMDLALEEEEQKNMALGNLRTIRNTSSQAKMVVSKKRMVKTLRRPPFIQKNQEDSSEREEISRPNIVWVGQNQRLLGDKIRNYLAKRHKPAAITLKSWLMTNSVSQLKSSMQDFFVHKRERNFEPKRSCTQHFSTKM